jgi:prophage maintenance system killer protein
MDLLHIEPVECAAAYLFYLFGNRPFVDGNKGAALATCLVVLSLNDLLSTEDLDVDAWEILTLEVASGCLRRNETTDGLRALLA